MQIVASCRLADHMFRRPGSTFIKPSLASGLCNRRQNKLKPPGVQGAYMYICWPFPASQGSPYSVTPLDDAGVLAQHRSVGSLLPSSIITTRSWHNLHCRCACAPSCPLMSRSWPVTGFFRLSKLSSSPGCLLSPWCMQTGWCTSCLTTYAQQPGVALPHEPPCTCSVPGHGAVDKSCFSIWLHRPCLQADSRAEQIKQELQDCRLEIAMWKRRLSVRQEASRTAQHGLRQRW